MHALRTELAARKSRFVQGTGTFDCASAGSQCCSQRMVEGACMCNAWRGSLATDLWIALHSVVTVYAEHDMTTWYTLNVVNKLFVLQDKSLCYLQSTLPRHK